RLVKRRRTRLMIKLTMRLLLPKVDAVIAVSRGAADDLERFAWLPKGLVRVIYNPAARGDTSARADISGLGLQWVCGGHKRLLAVGTLKTVKDFPTLLRAFARLRVTTDARLLILGDGEERS